MKSPESIHIRLLEEGDPPSIAAAFQNMGWNKPEDQYRQYLHEQVAGTRTCFVATVDGQFAGYDPAIPRAYSPEIEGRGCATLCLGGRLSEATARVQEEGFRR